MKIMLVCDSMGIGGAETHVLELAAGLSDAGHTVTVVARGGKLVNKLRCKSRGLVHFANLYARGRTPVKMAAYALALGNIIKKESPDVIHAHSRPTAFSLRLLIASGYIKKLPLVVTAHAKYRTDALTRFFSSWGDRCIAVSDDIKHHLCDRFGVPSGKIKVIPNGVDTDELAPSGDFEPFSVLFASRLDADSSHGAYCLCAISDELVRKYPQMKICIAGGGSELSTLRKSTRSIELLGALPSLFDAIRRSELVVGVSRVALEAMSCERNVILFGNEGALGLVDNGISSVAEKTNFTCRGRGIGDEVLLKNEIDRFFSMKTEKRADQAKRNRKYVIEHHSSKDTVKQTLSVYEGLISRPRRILIGGYYGFKNIGDNAMLSALLKLLSGASVEPSCISVLGKGKKKIGGVRIVGRYSPFDLFREMKKADVFILGGGSLFQNETSNRSLLYYCALVFLSKMLGCRCILISNGLGPLKSRLARAIVSLTLRAADRVSLRDNASLELARSLGRLDATLGADLCFSEVVRLEEGERVRRIRSKAKNGYVIIALKGNDDKAKLKFIKSLQKLCRSRGWTPVFVAMDNSEDGDAAKRLACLCGGIFAGDLTRGELLSLISSAEVTVGERLHFLIFSLLVGKSFVGVGASPKIVSFTSEALGMPTLDLSDPSSLAALADKARRISPDELSSVLQKYQNRSRNEFDNLKKTFFV